MQTLKAFNGEPVPCKIATDTRRIGGETFGTRIWLLLPICCQDPQIAFSNISTHVRPTYHHLLKIESAEYGKGPHRRDLSIACLLVSETCLAKKIVCSGEVACVIKLCAMSHDIRLFLRC